EGRERLVDVAVLRPRRRHAEDAPRPEGDDRRRRRLARAGVERLDEDLAEARVLDGLELAQPGAVRRFLARRDGVQVAQARALDGEAEPRAIVPQERERAAPPL